MHGLRRTLPLLGILLLTGACATPARTAGERIDDTMTTAAVKAKLAGDRLATLTQIDVDTREGVVTLSGVVPDETLRERAAYLAGQARGVRAVVNNLAVQQGTATPPPAARPAAGRDADEWRVADPTLRGSADDLQDRALREAAASNRAVAYERVDGSQRVEAYPLARPARGDCRWIQQRVFENGRLVDDQAREVCP